MLTSSVSALRPSSGELAASYEDDLFTALNAAALALFQARKIGVTVHVPDDVRQSLMARHGDEARRVLAALDGRVWL